MNKSESIKELALALSKAQSVLTNAYKDKDNPFFKSKYADLASVWECCREPLTSNGLSVVQTTCVLDNEPILETMLLHVSGEWISSQYPILCKNKDSQGMGSGVTYARRYSLMAMVGICPEDDDGNASVKQTPIQKPFQPKPPIDLPPPEEIAFKELPTEETTVGDYVRKAGGPKSKGKKLKDMPMGSHESFLTWCETEINNNKTLAPSVLDDRQATSDYLREYFTK